MLKSFILYILVSILLSIVCGQEGLATSQIARHGQFPFVVGLQYEKSEDRFVGALISDRIILTVVERIVENKVLHVYLGAHRFDELDEQGRVNLVVHVSNDVIVHPEYDGSQNVWDNLALIRLPKPVTFSEFIRPIALPTSIDNEELFDDEVVFVPGWGTQRPIYLPAKALHFINVTVESFKKCRNKTPVTSAQLCLDSSSGRTLCFGDDGAPVAIIRDGKPLLIGLANVPKTCVPDQPQVALRITYYNYWIENAIEDFDKLIALTK